VLTCAKERVPDLADWLIGRGAEHITVGQLDYVFSAKNALYDRLARRLG
jgi:ATP phosphoribosyltransferase